MYRLDYFLAKKAEKEQTSPLVEAKKLRAELGISYQTFNNLRNSEASNKLNLSAHLLKICQVLDCTVDEFFNPEAVSFILQQYSKE